MPESVNSMTSMQAIRSLMNLILKNWGLMFDCSTKYSIVLVVAARLQLNLVHMMNDIGLIFQVRVFERCCVMELCRQKKSFDLNLLELRCKEFSLKGLMGMINPFIQLEILSVLRFHFT